MSVATGEGTSLPPDECETSYFIIDIPSKTSDDKTSVFRTQMRLPDQGETTPKGYEAVT